MRIYPYSHTPLDFYFSQTARDFVVQEIPLYEFSESGEHCIVLLRKKNLSTFELIEILSAILGCKAKEIGYAGLKDKNALTSQYVSIPYSLKEKILQNQHLLEEKNIKILAFHRHQNKIRIGHLKGNSFFIRLKKVMPNHMEKIKNILEKISLEGIPNYFGYQRFGRFGDNFLEGKKIAHKEKKIRDKRLAEFLISSYQSHLFNAWLANRIKFCKILQDFYGDELKKAVQQEFGVFLETKELLNLQKQNHFFKILNGDAIHHYPYGKLFFASYNEIQETSTRFIQRDIVPCGILCGKKITPPSALAMQFQKDFLDSCILEIGSYRFAWIFPQNLKYRYIQEKAHLELSFELPKGSYATTLIEALANQEIKGENNE